MEGIVGEMGLYRHQKQLRARIAALVLARVHKYLQLYLLPCVAARPKQSLLYFEYHLNEFGMLEAA